jgi:hypothetical protein
MVQARSLLQSTCFVCCCRLTARIKRITQIMQGGAAALSLQRLPTRCLFPQRQLTLELSQNWGSPSNSTALRYSSVPGTKDLIPLESRLHFSDILRLDLAPIVFMASQFSASEGFPRSPAPAPAAPLLPATRSRRCTLTLHDALAISRYSSLSCASMQSQKLHFWTSFFLTCLPCFYSSLDPTSRFFSLLRCSSQPWILLVSLM